MYLVCSFAMLQSLCLSHVYAKPSQAACKNEPESTEAKRAAELLYEAALISSGYTVSAANPRACCWPIYDCEYDVIVHLCYPA
jgi:hypothetical protein